MMKKETDAKKFNINTYLQRLEDKLFPAESEGSAIVGKGFKPLAMTYADGLYHLFYVNNCSTWWTKAIYHAISYDMLFWRPCGKTGVKLFPLLSQVDAGSATLRNGKIEFIYSYHTPLFSGIRLTASRNKQNFAEHPVPLVDRKSLYRQHAPKNVLAFGVMHPRLFKFAKNFVIMTAQRWGKRNEFYMFSSPNLIDWEYKYKFMSANIKKGYRYAYPSPLRLGDKQYMLYSLVKDFGKEEIAGYMECAIRPAEQSITPLTYFKALPSVYSPRTVPLADGRMVLLCAMRDGQESSVMAMPRELSPGEGYFRMNAVSELLRARRREDRYQISGDADGVVRSAEGNKEYLIAGHFDSVFKMEFASLGAGHKVALEVIGREAKLIGKSSVYSAELSQDGAEHMRIIFRTGAVEVYFGDGEAVLGIPTGGKPAEVAFSLRQSPNLFVTEFDLEIE